MADDMDVKTTVFVTTDMLLINDDRELETWAQAIAENGGWAAYLPRMVASQKTELADGATLSEGHRAYMAAGTYDVYASIYMVNADGTGAIDVGGTRVVTGTTTGWVTGSVTITHAADGWIAVEEEIEDTVKTKANYGAAYVRFIDAV